MNLEEKTFPIKLKVTVKGLEISVLRILEYSVRSESGRIIELRDQVYYVSGLPKSFRIIYPQGIRILEGYSGIFIAHCHDDHDSHADLNFKEDNPGWQKVKPVERVYVKYDPKNNLKTHEAILPNQIYKEVKALASAVCVTN